MFSDAESIHDGGHGKDNGISKQRGRVARGDYRGRGRHAAHHVASGQAAVSQGLSTRVKAAAAAAVGADAAVAAEDAAAAGAEAGGLAGQAGAASDPGAAGPAGTQDLADAATAATSAPSAPGARGGAFSRHDERYTRRARRVGPFTRKQVGVLAVVAVLVASLSVAGGALLAMWQSASGNISLSSQDAQDLQEQLTQVQVNEPYWTLIVGSDQRPEETERQRSDVIMLVRIDPQAKKLTLVSIPRDTRVNIEGHGTEKINAAYQYGGPTLAVRTVEAFAGIKISHYVEAYFDGFEQLVDQLGGVTVDVPGRVDYDDVQLDPGLQSLTGHQALIMARNRKTYAEGDFTRTEAQRILVEAIAKKVLAQAPTQIPGTLQALSQCFATDIPLEEIVSIAVSMQGLNDGDMYSAMAPSTTGTVGGVSYTFTYIDQWKLMMQRADAGQDPQVTLGEAEILGTTSTRTAELDMDEPLSQELLDEIEAYRQSDAYKAEIEAGVETNGSTDFDGSGTSSSAGVASASTGGAGSSGEASGADDEEE